jgi:hypothetical protein
MTTGYREIEEFEMTRIEKLLLCGLVVFLLVGMFWVLDRTEELIPRPILTAQQREYGAIPPTGQPIEEELGVPAAKAQADRQQVIVDRRETELKKRETAYQDANQAYLFKREEYRTAMEAGKSNARLSADYAAARDAYEQRLADWKEARSAAESARAKYDSLSNRLDSLRKEAQKLYDQRNRSRDLWLFLIRFGYSSLLILIGWFAWNRARTARWRYLSIITAYLAASVLQLIFLLFRYCWELLADVAQLGVSVIGVIACVAAIVALKRYLFSPERVARARLSAHACPHCSAPFESGQSHCWDCGRPLTEPCPSCGASRLRYAPFCSHCGASKVVELSEIG